MKIIDRLIVLVVLLMVSISVMAGPTYGYMSGNNDGQILRTTIISDESNNEILMLNDQPGGIFKEGMESENEPFGGNKRTGRQRISGRDDSLVTPEGEDDEDAPIGDAMAPMMLLLAAFAAFKFYKK